MNRQRISSFKMYYIFKSRTHIIIAFILLAAIIFILHQMMTNFTESVIHELPHVQDDHLSAFQLSRHSRLRLSYKLTEKFLGEKLVHLDLKGAPPLATYLTQIFPLFKLMGATGILLEYEDMFPYYDKMTNIPAFNKYNMTDVTKIIEEAQKHELSVVPLIQTFGHLEFILKLAEYKDLREVESYPQVICPTNNKSQPLINMMIDQIVAAHPGIKYLHIGSDEVYHIGRCERCARTLIDRRWTKEELFLSHVRNVTMYIKQKYPNIRPIMWDDELRNLEEETIQQFDIPQLVDIMIWKYTPNVAEYVTDDILEKYSRLFKGVWIASAFKGATGPDSMITNIQHHLENHVSWMEIVDKWKNKLEFKGIALTGWQRYDHFSVLCELLPVAIPSLAVCLQYLDGQEVDENTMSSVLKCEFPISWGPSYVTGNRLANGCSFEGSSLYHLVNSFYLSLQEFKEMSKDVARGWLSAYNVIAQFSNPSHVEAATNMVDYQKIQMQYMEERLRAVLLNIYDKHTAEEWLATYVLPQLARLTSISEARERLLQPTVWARRPLDRIVSVQKEFEKICDGSHSLECSLLWTFG